MPGPRIDIVGPYGERGSVEESDLPSVVAQHWRPLTPEESAKEAVDARYAALPTGRKIAGVVGAALGGAAGPLGIGNPDAPPAIAAFGAGARHALSAGLTDAATKTVADAVGGPSAARQYAERRDQEAAASPYANVLGEAAGLVGSVAGGTGAIGALGKVGAPVGQVAKKALAGVAARGVAGRAAAAGGELAARGAIEGGLYSGIESGANSVTHDTPDAGDKLFSAFGAGALTTGVLAGLLGVGGTLIGSRLAASSAARLARGGELPVEAPPPPARRVFLDPDAGLHEGAGFSTEPIEIGKPRRPVWVHQEEGDLYAGRGTKPRSAGPLEDAVGIYNEAGIDKNALGGELGGAEPGFDVFSRPGGKGSSRAARRALVAAGLDEAAVEKAREVRFRGFGEPEPFEADARGPIRKATASLINPDAGLGELDAPDRKGAFEIENSGPRDVRFRAGNEAAPLESRSPFSIEAPAPAADAGAAALPAELGASQGGRGIIGELAAKYGPKLASKAVSKLAGKAVGGALGGVLGHTVGGPVGGVVGMAAGHAAAEWAERMLSRAGGVDAVDAAWNARLNKAAKGVLDPEATAHLIDQQGGIDAAVNAFANEHGVPSPVPTKPRAAAVAKQSTAQAIVQWLGDVRANPARIQGQLEDAARTVSMVAGPTAATAYTSATLRAVNFIAAHVPIKERRDPFDPRSVPPLNSDEADRLIRASRYAVQPWTVYDDFAKGRIYPEGIRAAKTFNPNEFARFQAELQAQVQERVLRDPTLTQAQRLRLDKLLGYAAGATLQRTSINRLQQNMLEPPRASPVGAMGEGSAPSAPTPPPIKLTIDHSGFGDNIEARKASSG